MRVREARLDGVRPPKMTMSDVKLEGLKTTPAWCALKSPTAKK